MTQYNIYDHVYVCRVPESIPDYEVGAYATWWLNELVMGLDGSKLNPRGRSFRVVDGRTFILSFEAGTPATSPSSEVLARFRDARAVQEGLVSQRPADSVDVKPAVAHKRR